MDVFVPMAVGAVLGWYVARGRLSWLAPLRDALNRLGRKPAPPPAETKPATLATRLQGLENKLVEFPTSSAHPRDFAEEPAFKEARAILADPAVSLDTVVHYALGNSWALASAALAALQDRADGSNAAPEIIDGFHNLVAWSMYFALGYLRSISPRPAPGAPLLVARDWWSENQLIQRLFKEHFTALQQLGDAPGFGALAEFPANTQAIRALLRLVQHPFSSVMIAELDKRQSARPDRSFLLSFGRFWSGDSELLFEPPSWQPVVETAMAALTQDPPRSLLVTGEVAAGKSSLLRLLERRLASRGWDVFEAGGADLMAGQQWFGQLEERIRKTTEEASVAKRIIWYVPDLMMFARSGTHQGQSASILDQILPAIQAGRLVIWAEAGPTSAAKLLQQRPGLRGLLEVIKLEPLPEAETLDLVHDVARDIAVHDGVTVDPAAAPLAVEVARQYLGGRFPGAPLTLLKLAATRAHTEGARAIGPTQILDMLAQLTGLPISILDSRERLDLDAIRQYFSARVIGQPEAVQSVVERIAMLKAGLNDPGKPVGVFLFAGPTGTGKTELAKTLASFLFGTPDRMIRLDMSEFQSPEAVSKILGDGVGETESLITRVRKEPFSVILLDEFEKSHPRVWDLFLQVFDEGRLSDALGQVADFRHCFIILTSNLGATTHQSSGLGFAPGLAQFSPEQVMRAIGQTYRPEFQNRLDKVIVFRPLTRELMRGILKKELDLVLSRRGLRDRDWAVEWEASALEFLLEKGFSPEMGARPLKRAIDQYLLAPLAETIVERRFPAGDQFVFVRSDGRALKAEFVDPDADTAPPAAPGDGEPGAAGTSQALPQMILAPHGTAEEWAVLEQDLKAVHDELAAPAWDGLKMELAERMAEEGFWQDAGRFRVLGRVALIDRVEIAADTAASLAGRLRRAGDRGGRPAQPAYSRELVSRLALQLHLVRAGILDAREDAPVEVAVVVEPALDGSGDERATADWCETLTLMYRRWAAARHMQVEEIARPGRTPILAVSGFGANRVLAAEEGLHVLDRGEAGTGVRVAARLLLVVTPIGDVAEPAVGDELLRRFALCPRTSTVVRRYRRQPPLVRDGTGQWRSGKLDEVLAGDFDLLIERAAPSAA